MYRSRPSDWKIVQQARAEFIIQGIRKHLPNSSLWHEKPFMHAQLESLVITSAGGLYSIDTFDALKKNLPPWDDIMTFDDLAIRVVHDARTHMALSAQDIEQIIYAANAEFETALSSDRQAVTSVFRRLTLTMDFDSPTDDINHNSKELLGIVADKLGYQLSYVPYITKDIWLPDCDFHDLSEHPEHARRAAEFIFRSPLPVSDVTYHILAVLKSTQPLRAPGVHSTFSGIPYVHDLHFIGRCY